MEICYHEIREQADEIESLKKPAGIYTFKQQLQEFNEGLTGIDEEIRTRAVYLNKLNTIVGTYARDKKEQSVRDSKRDYMGRLRQNKM